MHRPTLGSLYIQALKRNPAAVAVVEGDQEYTYAQVAERVGLLLALFAERDYRPGRGVGVAAAMGIDFLTWNMACHIGGLTFTDLPPSMPVEALVHRLTAGLETIVIQPAAFGERALAVAAAFPVEVLTTAPLPSYDDVPALLAGLQPAALSLRPAGEYATLAFTGGTTGLPKAMGFTGEAWADLAMIIMGAVPFPANPVTVVYRTGTSVMQLGLTQTLMRGGKVVTLPDFDFAQINAAGRKHGANVLFLASRMIYSLPDQADADWMPGQIKLIFHGGEPVTLAAMKRAVERFGPVFVSTYGSMETGGGSCFLLPEEHDLSRPERLASAGRSAPGVEIEVRDHHGRALPPGQVGEIAIRTPSQMICYVGNPEKTAETIRDGWIYTGDVGQFDDEHYLYILDRSAFAFQSGGTTVSPQAVDALLSEHPAVSMAITLAVEDAALTNLTCAAVTLRHGVHASADELKAFLAERPDAPMLHHVVLLEQLPQKAGNLKVDRTKVLELVRAAILQGEPS